MRLVALPAQQRKGGGDTRQHERLRGAGQVDLLLPLSERERRGAAPHAELGEGVERRGELPFAAVEEEEPGRPPAGRGAEVLTQRR